MTPPTTLDALRYLSSRCDGALALDGQGFNGMDSRFGKSLAERDWLSPKQEAAALRMLRKYRRQLSQGGIDYANLRETPRASVTVALGHGNGSSPGSGQPGRRVELDGDLFAIRYEQRDPQFADLLSSVRHVPDRRWDGRCWTVPTSRVVEVEAFTGEYGFAWSADARRRADGIRAAAAAEHARVANAIAASRAEDADIEIPIEGLRPFQKAGVAYALDKRRTFVADEMGLGKTLEALATVESEEAYPLLVVAAKTAISVWRNEIRRWLPDRTLQVVDTQSRISSFVDITVVPYSAVAKRAPALLGYASLVLDESHFIKNPKAQRTEAIQAIADSLDSDPLILLLTGSPVINRQEELVTQLQLIRQLDAVAGEIIKDAPRLRRQSPAKIVRYANTNQLTVALRANCMVRRLKADVLPELPPKTWATVEVPLDNAAEYRRAESAFLAWVQESGGDWRAAARAETLTRLNALRKLTARGKLAGAVEWAKDFLESDGKLVLFANHREQQEGLFRALGEYNPRRISSEMSADERGRQIEEFQTDESIRPFVMSSNRNVAMGVTLHAASNAAFLEFEWSPMDMDQGLDRTHRIGQEYAVTGYQLYAPGTVDEHMVAILAEKRVLVEAILDGRAPGDAEKVSILDDVVERMLERR